jgi:MazG family protein
MAKLRAPGGCPWDREQTFDTIKPFTLEETYEVLEAIDSRDWPELRGELGDLLLQVLFYAEMAQEAGHFSIDDVLDRLAEKLIARHPHVFGDMKAETSAEVLRNWEALKAGEKKAEAPASVLAGVSTRIPALLEAGKISSRAATAGFDWPHVGGLFLKLEEETAELMRHLKDYPAPGPRPQARGVAGSGRPQVPAELQAKLEDEVGDLFFVLVNIARYLALDPESALRKTNRKFRKRFHFVEEGLRRRGRRLEDASLDEMEALWQESKKLEAAEGKR